MKIIYLSAFFLFFLSVICLNAQTQTENYIRTTEYLDSIGESGDKKVTIMYFDGLGREKQLKQIGASPNASGNPGDLVTHFEYDGFGRQVKDFLPVPVASSNQQITGNIISEYDGFYGSAPYMTDYYYSEKTMENSPLNRVMAQAAPGDDWAKGAGHEIEFQYNTNRSGEVCIYWINENGNLKKGNYTSGNHYPANSLYKITTTDENGNKIHEFKDKQGRVVLKRSNVADGSTTGRNTDPDPGMEMMLTVDTYYVYDIYGNLAFVIPPLAAGQADPNEVLDELCYQYKYDDRNRLVEKKLPGKGWEFMVYDKQDRLVATQDANLRNDGGKWIFTKYDKFGRVVYTGITTGSRSTVQSAVNNAGSNNETRTPSAGFTKNGLAVYYSSTAFPTSFSELLSVNYYDSFQNINMNGAPAPSNTSVLKGLPVAASIRIIGSASWEHIYTYYDEKARPFKSYKKNHLGGFTQTESELDFRGKPLQTLTLHKRNPSGIVVKTTDYFVYDKMERLIRHSQSIGNATTRNLIAQNQYDRLGQLVAKKVGGTQLNGADRWQEVNYAYNIRGWLTRINDTGPLLMGKDAEPPGLGDDLFAFAIQYNELGNGGNDYTVPLYNGNIAQTFWKTAEDNILRGYHYTYDQMNRMRRADFYKEGNAGITAYGEFLSYDVNGNIKNLFRSTGDTLDNEISMDNLIYEYMNGNGNSNQLINVTDAASYQNQGGFKDGNTNPTLDDYEYDDNGNMVMDRNKDISNISYNFLNLPTEISFEGTNDKITYIYNAAGVKIRKMVREGDTQKIVEYLDGFQYAGGVLQFFPHPEGYVKATSAAATPGSPPSSYFYNYVYNYTDHLGNVRLSYSKDPATNELKIMDENHYYPFGLKHSVYSNGGKKDYKEDPSGPGGTVITNVMETEYLYKYNGQEFQDELGLNFYGMDVRGYDSALGRFNVIDPMAAFAPSHTPYRFGFNNPVYWADPTGMYETDGKTLTLKGEEEIQFYKDYMANGGTVEGLEMALQDAGFALELEAAVITGSPKQKYDDSQSSLLSSNQCIIGCHQTPGMGRGNTGNPFFRRTESETFYWTKSGGSGPGLQPNSFLRKKDKVVGTNLLDFLLASGRDRLPDTTELQAYADIFEIAQALGSTGNIEAALPPQAKDTVLTERVRTGDTYRGAYHHKSGGHSNKGWKYEVKDTVISTTTDKVEKVKMAIDSINNARSIK